VNAETSVLSIGDESMERGTLEELIFNSSHQTRKELIWQEASGTQSSKYLWRNREVWKAFASKSSAGALLYVSSETVQ
jgi:hypothetical protein